MTPLIWLFRLDATTIRVIQREYEGRMQVVVLGSEGLRTRQVFESAKDADAFRGLLTSELLGNGFTLTWTNAPSGSTTA